MLISLNFYALASSTPSGNYTTLGGNPFLTEKAFKMSEYSIEIKLSVSYLERASKKLKTLGSPSVEVTTRV